MVFRHHRWGQRAFGPQEASARNVSSWHNRTNESGTLIRPLSVVPSECVSLPAPGGVRAENCKLLTVTVDLTGGLHRLGRYSVHVHSPPPADCGESAVGYVDIVPRAIATDTAPRSVCEGAVHQIAVDGAYFLVSNGRPPVVNLQRIERTWDAVMDSSAVRSRLAHEAMTPSSAYGVLTHSPVFGAGGVMGVDVRSNVFGVFGNSSQNSTNGTNSTRRYNILLEEDNNRITDVRVTAVNCTPIDLYNSTLESCTRMLLEFDTTNHPFGLYAVGIVNLPVVDCCACGEKMPTLVNIVPRAEVHATGPTHVCEGGVHTMTVSGSYFVSTDGAPPTVSLGLLDDSWASVQATADVPRPVSEDKRARGIAAETQNASHVIAASVLSSTGCSNVSTAGSAMVVCDELVISFNTSGQLLGQYGLFVVNLPLADCCDCIQSESMRIDVVPRAEVHATGPTHVCEGGVHTMTVSGSYFVSTDGAPPTVSLGLLDDSWASVQATADVPRPVSEDKRARGIAAETQNASHVIAASVLSSTGCSNVSTAGSAMVVCDELVISFNTSGQLLGQYGLFVVNLPLADCCDCIQSESMRIDVVPRAEVHATKTTIVCQGSVHTMIVTGSYFLVTNDSVPVVSLGLLANTWNETQLQQDLTAPSSVSKRARGIAADTYSASHIISAKVLSAGDCTHVSTAGLSIESCEMIQIEFDAREQLLGQYGVYVVNLPLADCCDCVQSQTTTIDVVPRAHVVQVEPTAVCEGGQREVIVTGRYFLDLDGVPPRVQLEFINSDWNATLPATATGAAVSGAPAATSNMPTNTTAMQNTTANWQNVTRPGNESLQANTTLPASLPQDQWRTVPVPSVEMKGCTGINASHSQLRSCRTMIIRFNTSRRIAGLYRMAIRNLLPEECCACDERVHGLIDIVPRAQILDVFPPAVCTNSTHAIAVTGVHMATTNGVPPTVALRRITSQWTSDIPNTTMTPPWAGAENTSLAYSIDMDSIAPQNCTRTAANNLTLRRCNELDLTLRTHGILPGLYSVSVTNLPVVDCCDCMEEMSGEILIVPSESTGPTVGGGGVCSQCDIAHVNQLKLLARTRYAHCVCTWWYCCGNKRDAWASSLT